MEHSNNKLIVIVIIITQEMPLNKSQILNLPSNNSIKKIKSK